MDDVGGPVGHASLCVVASHAGLLRVVRAGEVVLSVHLDDHDTAVHEGELEAGVHTWSVAVPDGTECVTVRMGCEGHRTERRLQRKR